MRISNIDGKLICSNYVIYLSWVYVRRTARSRWRARGYVEVGVAKSIRAVYIHPPIKMIAVTGKIY